MDARVQKLGNIKTTCKTHHSKQVTAALNAEFHAIEEDTSGFLSMDRVTAAAALGAKMMVLGGGSGWEAEEEGVCTKACHHSRVISRMY